MRKAKKDNNNKTQKAPNLSPHPHFREKEESNYAGFVIIKRTRRPKCSLKMMESKAKDSPGGWESMARRKRLLNMVAHLMKHCCIN